MSDSQCLSDLELEGLARATLDATSADLMFQHLESCSECLGRIQQIVADNPGSHVMPTHFGAQDDSFEFAMQKIEKLPPQALSEDTKAIKRLLAKDQQVGDFRIVQELGRGGMGIVYLAWQESLQRHVALKVISMGSAMGEQLSVRFEREARSAANLHHSNIVPVFEYGRQGDIYYYSMQLIEGQSLDRIIRQLQLGGDLSSNVEKPQDASLQPNQEELADQSVEQAEKPAYSNESTLHVDAETVIGFRPTGNPIAIPASQSSFEQVSKSTNPEFFRKVARIGRDSASALAYAHHKGVIHRDIKPSNFILDQDDVVWLMDFGLALTEDQNLTQTGDLLGTLRYMSPERFSNECDARADIYALGLTLYEMLVLKPAFSDPDRLQLVEKIGNHEPTKPRTANPHVPRDLETIVLKAGNKDPGLRYQTATQMEEDLQRFLVGEPILARRPTTGERILKWVRRRPAIATLLAMLFVAVVTGLVGVTWQWRSAVANRREVQAQLAAVYTIQGMDRLDKSDPFGAMAWLAKAQEIDDQSLSAIPSDEDSHRMKVAKMRLDGIINTCPRLINMWYYEDVEWLEFSPDGRHLVLGGRTSTQIVDLENENAKPKTLPYYGMAGGVFCRDGKSLVLCSFTHAYIVDLVSHDIQQEVKLAYSNENPLHIAHCDSNGNLAITVGFPYDELSFWPGKIPKAIKSGHHKSQQISFSPDGSKILHGGRPSRIIDVEKKKVVTEFVGEKGRNAAVMYGPLGKKAMTTTIKAARLWDTATGEQIGEKLDLNYDFITPRWPGQNLVPFIWDLLIQKRSWPFPSPTKHIAISPDGRTALTTNRDGTVVLMRDTATGNVIRHPWSLGNALCWATFSPDSRFLVTARRDGIIRMWDLHESPADMLVLAHNAPVRKATFNSAGSRILTACDDGAARIWDAQNGDKLAKPMEHLAEVRRASFSRNDKWILTDSGSHPNGKGDKTFRLWDANTGQPLTRPLGAHLANRGVSSAVLSPDGMRVLVAFVGRFNVLNWETGASVISNVAAGKRMNDLTVDAAFSPDGKHVAVATISSVRIWNLSNGDEVKTTDLKSRGIMLLTYSSTGKYLIAAHKRRQSVVVIDGKNGKLLRSFSVNGTTRCLASNPKNEELVLTGCDSGSVRVWSVKTGLPVSADIPHNEQINDVAYSPDGRLFATACADGVVRCFDSKLGQIVLVGILHDGPVTSVAFSPDSRRIVTASEDGTARVWTLPMNAGAKSTTESIELATLLSGRSPDHRRGLTEIGRKKHFELWNRLKGKFPKTSKAETAHSMDWYRVQAANCEHQKNWKAAIFYLDILAKYEPNKAGWLRRRAMAQIKIGDYGPAVENLDKAPELVADTDTRYLRSRALAKLDQLNEALSDLEDVCEANPNHGPAWARRSQILGRKGKSTLTDNAFIEATNHSGVILCSDVSWSERATKSAWNWRDQWQEVAEDLDQRLEENGKLNPSEQRILGLAKAAIGDWKGAAEDLTTSHQADPTNIATLQCLIRAYAELGQWKNIPALSQTIRGNDQFQTLPRENQVSVLYLTALAHTQLEQWQGALDIALKATEIDSEHAECFFLQGQANLALKRDDDAFASFSKAVETNSSDRGQLLARCGKTLLNNSRWKKAAEYYAQAIELPRGETLGNCYRYAFACLNADQREGFRDAIHKLLSMIPNHQNRGLSEFIASLMVLSNDEELDWKRVIDLMEKALAAESRPEYMQLLGALYYRSGQYQKAVEQLTLETNVGWDWLIFRAMANHKLGDTKQATTEYKTADADFDKQLSNTAVDDRPRMELEWSRLQKEAQAVLNIK
jgi:eukaryotic-like serine/threonine-protein kinase